MKSASDRETPRALARAQAALRQHALSYPQTKEEFPWGHIAIKVKGKAFLFMGVYKNELSLSVKLPVSGKMALALPFASPTEYGLGKSGWVTARFAPKERIPLDMLKEWLDESFRAIAPKRVLAQFESGQDGELPLPKPAPRKRKRKRNP